MQNRLGIFAKHWTPGQVKTRLGTIGMETACQIYFQLLKGLVNELRNEADHRTIVYAPRGKEPEFTQLSRGDWDLVAQAEGGLGDRLKTFFEDEFKFCKELRSLAGLPNVVVIGADCPEVNVEIIREAFFRLQRSPVVIGPSWDGGYYLIGLNQPYWEVFQQIEWSTDRVFSQTLACLNRLGVTYELLPTLRDVDTPDDLTQLMLQWSRDPLLDANRQRLLQHFRQLLHGQDS